MKVHSLAQPISVDTSIRPLVKTSIQNDSLADATLSISKGMADAAIQHITAERERA